jgi:hypothetical protein
MDRYWIAREHQGLNRVAIPSLDDLKKYSKGEDHKPKDQSLDGKAELCAEIIKLRNSRVTEKQLVQSASTLMGKSMDHLLDLREKIRYAKSQPPATKPRKCW